MKTRNRGKIAQRLPPTPMKQCEYFHELILCVFVLFCIVKKVPVLTACVFLGLLQLWKSDGGGF